MGDRKAVIYRWVLRDPSGIFLDKRFERLYDLQAWYQRAPFSEARVGLTQQIIHRGRLIEELWAWVDEGTLPTHFENGPMIPARLRKEFKMKPRQ